MLHLEVMFEFQSHICSMTDWLCGDQRPGGGAPAGAPTRQSHDSHPNAPHHSFSHSSRQPGASRPVSGCHHTFIYTDIIYSSSLMALFLYSATQINV